MKLFMSAALFAAVISMLPQNADAQRPSLGGLQDQLDDVQGTLGPVPAPDNNIQQQIDALKRQLDVIQSISCLATNGVDPSNLPGLCSRIVFVTSSRHNADFGAVSGAADGDAICAARAAEAGLPGTYKAWLSDSTSSPSTRFAKAPLPYVRTDGVVVANNYGDLIDGSLAAPISLDENKASRTASPWTGTNADGTPSGATCSDWNSLDTAGRATTGSTTATDRTWSNRLDASCSSQNSLPLLCFQQQ